MEKANKHSSLDQTGSVQSVKLARCQTQNCLFSRSRHPPPSVVLAKVDLNLLHIFCNVYIKRILKQSSIVEYPGVGNKVTNYSSTTCGYPNLYANTASLVAIESMVRDLLQINNLISMPMNKAVLYK